MKGDQEERSNKKTTTSIRVYGGDFLSGQASYTETVTIVTRWIGGQFVSHEEYDPEKEPDAIFELRNLQGKKEYLSLLDVKTLEYLENTYDTLEIMAKRITNRGLSSEVTNSLFVIIFKDGRELRATIYRSAYERMERFFKIIKDKRPLYERSINIWEKKK